MAENVCPDSGPGFLLNPDAVLALRGEQLLRAWVHSQTKLASDQPQLELVHKAESGGGKYYQRAE